MISSEEASIMVKLSSDKNHDKDNQCDPLFVLPILSCSLFNKRDMPLARLAIKKGFSSMQTIICHLRLLVKAKHVKVWRTKCFEKG